MIRLLRPLLLVVLSAVFCEARPNGAPQSACSSLFPLHSGIEEQKSRAPYTVSATRIGDRIRVTISSPVGEDFEGFVLQARSRSDTSRPVEGKFTSSQVSKTIDCFRGKQNTLTQVGTSKKREVVTEWTPDRPLNEDIIFRATVAKTFALFWTEVDSVPVRMGGSDGGSSGSGTTSGTSGSRSHSMYDECFRSKGCFGYPSGCVVRTDCEVLLSFTKRPDGILLNMHGYLQDDNYMAMALSTDARMGDDSVVECFRRGSDVVARQSWNEGKTNTRTRDFPRNSYSGDFTNGLTSCSWTAQFLTEINGQRYNLENRTYFALLAKGPISDGRLSYHSGRLSSQEGINFTALESVEGEGVSDSVKIHGDEEDDSFMSPSSALPDRDEESEENGVMPRSSTTFAADEAQDEKEASKKEHHPSSGNAFLSFI